MKKIKLTQGKYALVDDEDYEILNKYKWHLERDYAVRSTYNKVRGRIRMHRQILNINKNLEVDHINRNGLDNRRINLRACTRSQNNRNVGKHKDNKYYKGIYKRKDRITNVWRAHITYNYKQVNLGCFSSKINAARAYDCAAIKLFGKFANLNFK